MTDRKQLDTRPTKNTEAKEIAATLRPVRRLARGVQEALKELLAHEIASAFERDDSWRRRGRICPRRPPRRSNGTSHVSGTRGPLADQ